MNDTTERPPLPDRLCVDPRSKYHVAAVFEHPIGIRLNDKERHDVEDVHQRRLVKWAGKTKNRAASVLIPEGPRRSLLPEGSRHALMAGVVRCLLAAARSCSRPSAGTTLPSHRGSNASPQEVSARRITTARQHRLRLECCALRSPTAGGRRS